MTIEQIHIFQVTTLAISTSVLIYLFTKCFCFCNNEENSQLRHFTIEFYSPTNSDDSSYNPYYVFSPRQPSAPPAITPPHTDNMNMNSV